jgi:adenylate kinase
LRAWKGWCWKGYTGKFIKRKINLNYIGSGELLRNRKQESDFTGKKIAECIDKGGLVPTPVIFSLWMRELERIRKLEKNNGILIDGSPRKILEVHLIEEAINWYEWSDNFKIILIDISDEESLKRIKERAKIEGREDDDEDALRVRLGWFKEEVMPVINYYEERNRLIKINGEQSIEGVYNEILQKLEL